jgi:hypothetical protein
VQHLPVSACVISNGVCINIHLCRSRHEDLTYVKLLPNYTYAVTTANANLRTHLEGHHEEEYVAMCVEKGWPMQLAKRKRREMFALENTRQTSLDGVVVPGK